MVVKIHGENMWILWVRIHQSINLQRICSFWLRASQQAPFTSHLSVTKTLLSAFAVCSPIRRSIAYYAAPFSSSLIQGLLSNPLVQPTVCHLSCPWTSDLLSCPVTIPQSPSVSPLSEGTLRCTYRTVLPSPCLQEQLCVVLG